VRVSVAAEARFVALWDAAETVPLMAALVLDRALRLSDLGRTGEAVDTLARLAATVRANGNDIARLERAQAVYWLGRFLRERGDIEASRRALVEVVREFADDPVGDVRVWAANALWSAWRSDRVDDAEAADLHGVFVDHFDDDPDARIRRLDASGRLSFAVTAHESGDTARAITLLNEIIARFADADDVDIQDTVRRARENLHILTVSASAEAHADDEATARYRSLRDRLYAADGLAVHGQLAEAEQVWRAVIDESTGTEDLDLAMLRLAALDSWAGWAEEAGQWEQLAALARQATIIRSGADARAERVRARAHLRLGVALGRLGDPRGAIRVYEALDALASGSSDGDIATARQQAVYNRAVMIDDLGDGFAALAAYEHAVAVHGQSVASAGGRLRCAKALRNQALIFAGLGRIAEAAGAHRRVLDLATGSTDPQLLERVRKSAFDLASAFTALGDPASAASTYAWMRSAAHIGFSADEMRTAARAEKQARRLSR
jgi:tetratricopeptide (TPR) repeat protein